MNYIELFANGGLTKSEKSEGEQRAMQLLESLQELTGVDPKHAAEILNQFKDDPETVNSIQEYVNLAIDPKSDENTRSNAISELTKIFNPSMFKCGGKLQQLVTKFGKGGPVDCGCGGIKLDMGGPVKDGEYTRSDFFNELNEWTPVKLPNGDSGYARNYRKPLFRFGPSSNTLTQMLVTYDENGTPRASSREIKGFFNPNRVKLDTTYNTANNTSASKDFINRINFALEGVAPERPQSKQDGGSIELTQLPGHDVNTTLTRRQARQLAMDKGRYANNAQFQTAMANAMNAARSMGLRGAEARQRAMEMVAGVNPAERTVTIADPPVADINTFDFNKAKEIPDYIEETGAVRKFGQPAVITEPKFAGLETQQLLDKTNTKLIRSLNASGQQVTDSKDQETQLKARGMYFPRIDSSLEEGDLATEDRLGNNSYNTSTNLSPEESSKEGLRQFMANREREAAMNKERRQALWWWNWYHTPGSKPPVLQYGSIQQPSGRGRAIYVPYQKQGGQIEKGQGGFPNGILTDKTTMLKGPSIGQRRLGVIRPWVAQHIIYHQQANPDTLYFGKNVNAFDPSLPVNITDRETMVLPQSVKNKLANIIDSDYSDYNYSVGSYPNNLYEKTIDTIYKKK